MKMRWKESGNQKQSEKEKDEGYLPSYFFEEKERRGVRTSASAVCEVPIAIGRVVCSQQNEIKNPEMGLHFNGIKPPRHFVPPLLSLRAGGEMTPPELAKLQNENENGNENEY